MSFFTALFGESDAGKLSAHGFLAQWAAHGFLGYLLTINIASLGFLFYGEILGRYQVLAALVVLYILFEWWQWNRSPVRSLCDSAVDLMGVSLIAGLLPLAFLDGTARTITIDLPILAWWTDTVVGGMALATYIIYKRSKRE